MPRRGSPNRIHRRPQVAAAFFVLFVGMTIGLTATPALAATCSGSGTAVMTIDLASGESVSLSLSGQADPRVIEVTPADPSCAGFDTGTVTSIQVNGTDGNETVTIDQSGAAPFPHQNTASIVLALGAGSDALVIQGQAVADTIGFGAGGISLDAGETPDVTGVDSVESFTVLAADGDDTVSGAGEGGLGGEFALGLTLDGGSGNDTLRGGAGGDSIQGGAGDDELKGGPGDDAVDGGDGGDDVHGGDGGDTVVGGSGEDDVSGGDAVDTVRGGSGNDVARGGEGDDAVAGEAGNDLLKGGRGADELTGGPGSDELRGGKGDDGCVGGPGPDSFTGCEDVTL